MCARLFCQISNLVRASDTIFMNTCSFIIHLKKISACSKVFVEYIDFFVELKEASSF